MYQLKCYRKWEKFVCVQLLLLIAQSGTTSTPSSLDDDLRAPHSVTLEARTENSLTILWKMEETEPSPNSYTVHYYAEHEPDKVMVISTERSSTFISNLKPATNYTVYVTAHYLENKNASSLKFVMATRDTSNSIHKDCSCYSPGTTSCNTDVIDGEKCICRLGFEGLLCDVCSRGYYQMDGECHKCPCPKETTYETCERGSDSSGPVSCSCQEGYLGPLCDSCVKGFYPVANNNRCVKCQCFLCQIRQEDSVHCNRCPPYSLNITNHEAIKLICGAKPRSQQRSIDHSDGTVAIVAAFLSLAFIACVAGGVTLYRRRLQARNEPPFWSIELTEDKMTLSSGSEYERLGEGSSKQHLRAGSRQNSNQRSHERSPSVAEVTAAQRDANQPQYNCISI